METPLLHSFPSTSMAKSPSPALVELGFRAIVVGSESVKKFQSALLSRAGWTSEKSTEFPLDVVLGLEKPANIYKVVVEVVDENAPSQVEALVGSYPGNETVEPSYENASGADYTKKGTMRFPRKSKKESLQDSQTLFVDSHGQFLWLIIDAPDNPKASGDQVSIHRVKVFGYNEKYEKAKSSPKDQDRRAKGTSRAESAKRGGEDMRFSSEGDGLTIPGNNLGEDPLTSLRIVKKVLGSKRDKALKEDKTVEAAMCLRAIDRMGEYEKRVERLKSKMSEALMKGDTAAAEKYRLAAADCRDTVFRSAHVDLLLQRSELRSIGVESKWADEEQEGED